MVCFLIWVTTALVLLILFCACCMILVSWLSLVEFCVFIRMVRQNSIYAYVIIQFTFNIHIYYYIFIEVLQNAWSSELAFLTRGICSFLIYLSHKSFVFFVHLPLFCLISIYLIYDVALPLHSLILYWWRKRERLSLIERVIFCLGQNHDNNVLVYLQISLINCLVSSAQGQESHVQPTWVYGHIGRHTSFVSIDVSCYVVW